ncbi:Nn.00g086070.m01.CDS01 [Neocucurbitaria sp. VM-36]
MATKKSEKEQHEDVSEDLSEEDSGDDDVEIFADEPDTGVPVEALKHLKQRSTTLHSPFAWEYLANWEDAQPFIGYRSFGARSADHYRHVSFCDMVAEMYNKINGKPCQPHPSKPGRRCNHGDTYAYRNVLPIKAFSA